MKMLRYGLAAAGLIAISTAAYAAGLWPNFPVVGGASYCAGSSQSAIDSIIGTITGCPNTVPAGPTVVTGNERILADTNLSGGAAPQTVLLSLGSLNALPLQFVTVTNPNSPAGISASNTSGGVVYSHTSTITSANITLPTNPIDGQQFVISSNRTITTLSVQAATPSNTLAGNTAPSVLTASLTVPQGYTFVFNAASNSWFRLR